MLRSVDDSATFWTVFSMQPWGDPGCNWWRNRWHVQMPQLLTYAKIQQRSRHISAYLDLCPSKWPRWQAFRMSTACLCNVTNWWCSHYDDHGTGSGTSGAVRDKPKDWLNWLSGATWRQELALWTGMWLSGSWPHGHFIVQRCASTMWHRVSTMWLTSHTTHADVRRLG